MWRSASSSRSGSFFCGGDDDGDDDEDDDDMLMLESSSERSSSRMLGRGASAEMGASSSAFVFGFFVFTVRVRSSKSS